MRYIDCVKEQLKIVVAGLFSGIVTYNIACHFKWREPYALSIGDIAWYALLALCFVIGGSCARYFKK